MIKDQTDNVIIAKETTKDPREALNICLKKKCRSVYVWFQGGEDLVPLDLLKDSLNKFLKIFWNSYLFF